MYICRILVSQGYISCKILWRWWWLGVGGGWTLGKNWKKGKEKGRKLYKNGLKGLKIASFWVINSFSLGVIRPPPVTSRRNFINCICRGKNNLKDGGGGRNSQYITLNNSYQIQIKRSFFVVKQRNAKKRIFFQGTNSDAGQSHWKKLMVSRDKGKDNWPSSINKLFN